MERSRAADPTIVLYEIGRQIQRAALMMRRHQVIGRHQLCECGRLPTSQVPIFGPRCEVAAECWTRAHEMMRRFTRTVDTGRPDEQR